MVCWKLVLACCQKSLRLGSDLSRLLVIANTAYRDAAAAASVV
jgi:hypothetical protein